MYQNKRNALTNRLKIPGVLKDLGDGESSVALGTATAFAVAAPGITRALAVALGIARALADDAEDVLLRGVYKKFEPAANI